MAKLRCPCGHIIVDQRGSLPYKGHILRDQNYQRFFEMMEEEIDGLVQAVSDGKRDEWVGRNFPEPYPRDLRDGQMAMDLASPMIDLLLWIYQCEQCGRILIEDQDSNHFRTFVPEGEWQGTLEVREERDTPQ